MIDRDHGNARGQGLQNGEPKGLIPTREGEDISSGIACRQALPIGNHPRIGGMRCRPHKALSLRAEGTIANDAELIGASLI